MKTKAAVPWPVFQAVITVHALAVAAQPVFAGGFLSGDVASLERHRLNATIAGLLGIGLFVLALVNRLLGGGWRFVAVCLALAGAEATQIFLGYNRILDLHVPLGVTIVAGAVVLLIWAWRRPAGVTQSRP